MCGVEGTCVVWRGHVWRCGGDMCSVEGTCVVWRGHVWCGGTCVVWRGHVWCGGDMCGGIVRLHVPSLPPGFDHCEVYSTHVPLDVAGVLVALLDAILRYCAECTSTVDGGWEGLGAVGCGLPSTLQIKWHAGWWSMW